MHLSIPYSTSTFSYSIGLISMLLVVTVCLIDLCHCNLNTHDVYSNIPTFQLFLGLTFQHSKVRPKQVGLLEVGMLECWKVGMLESWKVGMLESWEVGKLESREVRKLESKVQQIGKLKIAQDSLFLVGIFLQR